MSSVMVMSGASVLMEYATPDLEVCVVTDAPTCNAFAMINDTAHTARNIRRNGRGDLNMPST